MPRRLGLSDVVDRQIRQYRDQVKKRAKITDQQAQDLFHLVLRRPDSEEAFMHAGEILGEEVKPTRGIGRLLPEKARFARARRRTRQRIQSLFGRGLGGFAHGLFTLEARGHFLLGFDPGGDACALVTGMAQAILRGTVGRTVAVHHVSCEARKQDLCRWVLSEPD
jgi:hypothetical protein